jgi:Zn-dependent oligopeptidase
MLKGRSALHIVDVHSIDASRTTTGPLQRLARARELFEDIDRQTDPGRLLRTHNELLVELTAAKDAAELLGLVHPDADVRSEAEGTAAEASSLETALAQHGGLYEALGRADEDDSATGRVVALVRRDMRRAGVELDAGGRERVRNLRAELKAIGQRFLGTLRDDVRRVVVRLRISTACRPTTFRRTPPRTDL